MQSESVKGEETRAQRGELPETGNPPAISAEQLNELVETYRRDLTRVWATWRIPPWHVREHLGIDATVEHFRDWQLLKKFDFGELGYESGFRFHCEIANIPDLVKFVREYHIQWRRPLIRDVTLSKPADVCFFCSPFVPRKDEVFARTCEAAGLTRCKDDPLMWELWPSAEDPAWITEWSRRSVRGPRKCAFRRGETKRTRKNAARPAGSAIAGHKVVLELRFRSLPEGRALQRVRVALEAASFRHNGGPVQCLRLDPKEPGEEIVVFRLKSRKAVMSDEEGVAWVKRLRKHLKVTVPSQNQLLEPVDSAVVGLEEDEHWVTITMYFRFALSSRESQAVQEVVKRLCRQRHALILRCDETWGPERGDRVVCFRLRSLRTWPSWKGGWTWAKRFRAELIQKLPHQDWLLPVMGQCIEIDSEHGNSWHFRDAMDEVMKKSTGWLVEAPTATPHVHSTPPLAVPTRLTHVSDDIPF